MASYKMLTSLLSIHGGWLVKLYMASYKMLT